MMRRALIGVLATAGLLCGPVPEQALAHGLVGRGDLPIPPYLFAWGASLVLVISFVALAVLWKRPVLQQAPERPLLRVPRGLDIVAGAAGVALFAAVVYAGLAGTQQAPNANLAPNVVYVLFWVGLVPLSALLGPVFSAVNPWRAIARASAATGRRAGIAHATREYPPRVGRWPAALGIAAFAWLELVYADHQQPRLLALLAVGYAVVQLAGMYRYGIDEWTQNADPFAVYFGLFAAMAPLARRGATLVLRVPLAGLTQLRAAPGTLALLFAIIGSTTFDGLSNGEVWAALGPRLADGFSDLGSDKTLAAELAGTVGLGLSIALIAGVYRFGVKGMAAIQQGRTTGLADRFVHSLVPIAFAYAMAHYLSLLLFQGQAVGYLASDPLGDGTNLIGTAGWAINYTFISAVGIWYAQTALLIGGHAAALALAHDRALSTFSNLRTATRSQYWMLTVMVGYTSLGLFLLSTIKT